jgi:hypothetical protein
MAIANRARSAFLLLPGPTQRAALRALGRRAPWDPDFDHRAPQVRADMAVGPPDFVGIGAQKAGTSWWYTLMLAHPGIYGHDGFHKERHFFDRFHGLAFSADDVTRYHEWFPRPFGSQTGEWTPDYMLYHWVPAPLRQAAPQAKLLVLLRDPVERYRSGLGHHRTRGEVQTPMIATEAFARGLYSEQLSRFEAHFPTQQMLVLQYEACAASPGRHLDETMRFLGLPDGYRPPDLDRRINVTRSRPQAVGGADRRLLTDLYAEDVSRLAARYPHLDIDLWPNFAGLAL